MQRNQENGKNLRILSYNVHMFSGTVASKESKDDDERLKQICKNILKLDPDIVCLCEVWADSMKKKFVEHLDPVFPYTLYHDLSAFQMGDGLLICSKHPIYNRGLTTFNNLVSWDRLAQKGFLLCCVKYINNNIEKDFRLFFSHTQSGDKSYQTAARQKNLQQIQEAVCSEAYYYPDAPTIICGDLNVDNLIAEQYNPMMTLFNSEQLQFKDCGKEDNKTTYVGGYSRLDYILISKENENINLIRMNDYKRIDTWKYVSPETEKQKDLSDHYPIMVDISIETPSTIPHNEFKSLVEAEKAAEDAKNKYGYGVSNLITIANPSNWLLHFHDKASFSNSSFQFLQPSFEIEKNQFGAAFHHHENKHATGSWGCMVYRVFNYAGAALCDAFMGFESPFSGSNTCYVEVREVGHWWKKASSTHMKDLIDSGGAHHFDIQVFEGLPISIEGNIGDDSSPKTSFKISPFYGYTTGEEARQAAAKAKKRYGNGISTKITICNNTNLKLELINKFSWNDGEFEFLSPTPIITGLKFGAAFHHHENHHATGSWGCIIYRAFDSSGTALCDIFMGFEAPFMGKNSCYVDIKAIDTWWNKESKEKMKDLIDDGPKESSKRRGIFLLTGGISNEASPWAYFQFNQP